MARNQRFSRGSGRDAPRRLTAWSLGPGGDDLATMDSETISADGEAVLGTGVLSTIPNVTIVRIRGYAQVLLTTAVAAQGGFNFAFGIGIVSADAFAIGVTAVPKPFTDADWPGWLWHHQGAIQSANGALAVGDPTDNPVRIPIDTKAMRKLRLNEVCFGIVEQGEVGSAIAQVKMGTRMLIKLP